MAPSSSLASSSSPSRLPNTNTNQESPDPPPMPGHHARFVAAVKALEHARSVAADHRHAADTARATHEQNRRALEESRRAMRKADAAYADAKGRVERADQEAQRLFRGLPGCVQSVARGHESTTTSST